MTTETELILPENFADAKALLSEKIGEITELRTWVKLQYEGRASGLRVNWEEIRAAQGEIAELQGDINALKAHITAFREDENKIFAAQSLEKKRLKAEAAERQRIMQREAIELKNDRRVAVAEQERRKSEAAHKAVLAYIAASAPEHLQPAKAVAAAARMVAK